MAKVLHGTIRASGKVYESGTPFSKLPKDLKQVAIDNGLLVDEDEEATLVVEEPDEDEE
jgi:hypothetical protein